MDFMKLRIIIKEIVNGRDKPISIAFDWFILALIVYSVVTLTLETMPGWSAVSKKFFNISEFVVTGIFTLEYAARLFISGRKLVYVKSFEGIVDLVAIAPFYFGLIFGGGVDLRAIRAFRLVRVLRLLKLVRYNKAIRRVSRAFVIAREELVLYMILTLILLYLSATGIYYFERVAQPGVLKSIPHCLWWAVTTLTTVGYGDIYPVTVGGRFFTFVVLMIGLGVVAAPAGIIASAFSQARREE